MWRVALLLVTSVFIGCNAHSKDKIQAQDEQIKRLEAELAELRQKQTTNHHYELRNEGSRTWRFDPATGETCIQLTSAADWKRNETKSQSCDCVDANNKYGEMPMDTGVLRRTADNYYKLLVKPACGF